MSEYPNPPAEKPHDDSGHLHRRRRMERTGGDIEQSGQGSVWAMAGMALCCLFAMLAAGAPMEILHGVLWMGVGLLLVVFPPPFRIGKGWLAGGILVLGGASLAFLPEKWFVIPEWRKALESLGQNTGSLVTPQPCLTVELLAGLAVSVVVFWYLRGHRVSARAHLPLATSVLLGIGVYVLVSIAAFHTEPRWIWDPVETFGLYGNRNHTATLLAMGALGSLGVMAEAVRSRRGGFAGLAALVLVICGCALIGYSISRAGILLLGVGVMIWAAFLGKSYVSARMLLALSVFAVAVGAIFWSADTEVKRRLVKQWESVRSEKPAGSNTNPMGTAQNEGAAQPDFRVFIYKDTFELLRHEPAVGIGLGQFPYIFPQYRKESLAQAKCWHPESNWLLLAAEAGWGTALAAAVTVGALFVTAFRSARRRRGGWALSLGTLLAALLVPVHGLFDVPAYHTGIAWTALLLAALSFRAPEGASWRAGVCQQWLFKIAGALILLGGVWMLSTAFSGRTLNLTRSSAAATRITEHYSRAVMEKVDPVRFPVEKAPDGSPVNHLLSAAATADAALEIVPMEPLLHYLKGYVLVGQSGAGSTVDEAFARQRLLVPDWVTVPYWQGVTWMERDPERTRVLWREAIRRAEVAEKKKKDVYWSPRILMREASYMVAGKPALEKLVRELSSEAGIK